MTAGGDIGVLVAESDDLTTGVVRLETVNESICGFEHLVLVRSLTPLDVAYRNDLIDGVHAAPPMPD